MLLELSKMMSTFGFADEVMKGGVEGSNGLTADGDGGSAPIQTEGKMRKKAKVKTLKNIRGNIGFSFFIENGL